MRMRASRLAASILAVAALSCSGREERREARPAPEAAGTQAAQDSGAPAPATIEHARELARRFIIMDGHVDLPHRLGLRLDSKGQPTEDVSRRTEHGNFDHPRAVEGGLDAPFMSIYVPSSFQESGGARKKADQLIDMVEAIAARFPDKFAVARSPDQVVANSAAGRVSLPMGIENGAAIEDDLANLAHFHGRGVRYITLTHSTDNLICDSSYDKKATWKGLSPYGRKVVAEMNRLGIMIDVSHISDQAFDQVIEETRTPVIASHSSARHFTPGFLRNLDDERIKKLAAGGGVLLINFGSSFINEKSRAYFDQAREAIRKQVEGRKPPPGELERDALQAAYAAAHPPVLATVDQVADHIMHVIQLVGVDHVGFGSDFDGVGNSLPPGLEDVSGYPNLIKVLLERGVSEADVEKICGGNFLRVWRAVEKHAQQSGPKRSPPSTGN
jgi:membrane dipeptidase